MDIIKEFDGEEWEHWMNMEDIEKAQVFVGMSLKHGFRLLANTQTYDVYGRLCDDGWAGIWRVPGHRADYSDVWKEYREKVKEAT